MTNATLPPVNDNRIDEHGICMPVRVDRMPLSWYCPIRGKDIAIGYRVWAGLPGGLGYGKATFRVTREPGRYVVTYREIDTNWYFIAAFAIDGDATDARQRAIACAEWHEGELFNGCQPDPRSAIGGAS